MNTLKISKNGKLYKTSYNSETKKHETEEVSRYMISHLFENCEIEDKVSMRDIFLLCKNNLPVLSLVIRNWIEEWVEYGINLPTVENKGTNYNDIEFMELYWTAETFDGELSGTEFPDFHCLAYESTEDVYECDRILVEKGKRINYGISSIDHLIDIPLKLNDKFEIYDENYKVCFSSKKGYRLIDVIYGIIWEISFHGGPDMVKTFWSEMDEQVKEIEKGLENGTLETFTLDEVKEKLKNTLDELKNEEEKNRLE